MECIDTALETYFRTKNPYSYNNEEYKKTEKGEIIVFEQKENKNDNIAENKTKKNDIKKINSIKTKQKGDIELKNIYYRIYDKRYIGIKQIHKQKIIVYAKTQKACYEKLKNEVNKVKSIFTKVNTKTKLKFITYWQKWYEQNKKPFITKATAQDIERISQELKELHDIEISKIDKDKIINVLNKFTEGRKKEKIILYLKACFKTAFNDGTIKINPFANIVTKPRIIKRKPAFTYDQQEKILNRLNKEEIQPIILIYLITGLRRRELDFKDIDKYLYEEDMILKALNLKSRNQVVRYKFIQLSKEGFNLIKNNIELLKKYNEETVYRKFAEILKELNIKGSIVNLRHTFATNNFYLGNPELFISRQMGHATSQITKDNYTDIDYHLSKEKILKLYNNLYYIFD